VNEPAAAAPPDVAGPSEPRPSRWERFSRSPLRAAVGALACAGAMAAYAHFIGCRTGTCPLTSNVWIAASYGAAMGALAGWPGRSARR
jgi:hypothetical protein